jgi:hypothetical protein
MIFKIVNPDTLVIEHSYEADVVQPWGGPWGQYTHLEVVSPLDPDCVKAELIEDVIALVEDTAKTAAKALAIKVAQCDALEAQLWVEILAEMETVYGTKDMNSATAYYLSWRRFQEAPAMFVGPLFADEAAVTAYVTPKLAAADVFALWRLNKIMACNAAKQAIMEG